MGILGSIGSFVSDIAGPVAQYMGAKYSADKQYEIWHEQRDWNTPAAQMARYKAAGVNPYAALGQISSGNISTMPQAADYSGAAEGVGNIVNNALNRISQREGIKAQKLDNGLKEQTLESNAMLSSVQLLGALEDLQSKKNQNSAFETELDLKRWQLYNLVRDYDKKGVDIGLLNWELGQHKQWDNLFNRLRYSMDFQKYRSNELDISRKEKFGGVPSSMYEYLSSTGLLPKSWLTGLLGLLPAGGFLGAGLKLGSRFLPSIVSSLGKGGVASPVLGYEWGKMLESTMR